MSLNQLVEYINSQYPPGIAFPQKTFNETHH